MSGVPDIDSELIRRAARGDASALERFLLLHRPTLLRYLRRRIPEDLRRHIEPDDVFQDVCFDVFRRMSTINATDRRTAVRWLLRIAHNRVVDLIRMHKTSKRGGGQLTDLSDTSSDPSIEQLLQQLAVYVRTPSRSAISHELVAALEQSLARLPPDYRQVIRYRYIDCLPFKETGDLMNRSEAAVQKLCRRGLDALRMELRSCSRYI